MQAASGGWCVLALDYELGAVFEPKAGATKAPASAPLARIYRFADCQVFNVANASSWLHGQLDAMPKDKQVCGIGDIQAACSATTYAAAVARIQQWIAAGDCYQVNFTFPLDFSWWGHPLALYSALRERQPVRYGGVMMAAGETVVSLSPELFLAKAGDRVWTRPMKGTAPRSTPPEALRESEKNRAENLMIVDLLRNDLGRVAQTGSVHVESLFEIEAYPTVWQMVSQVAAQAPGRDVSALLAALFPCGSVTGAPKIRAMQIINEIEQTPRGLYTGAFGWLAPSGDFRLNVPIRTLELAVDGRGRMGVGSGIVADSEAAQEWQECAVKSAFLTELDPGIKLIETLRRVDDLYPRLEGHLARLATSAAWLGFPCDLVAVRQALAELPGGGVMRVRLTLDKAGAIEVQCYSLAIEPEGPRYAVFATDVIDSTHPLRRHKTTYRASYDKALAAQAATPDIFDSIFLNERGEIVEGARSTVFVERDGVLLTPPVSSGALPGVLRADLLESGRAREEVLFPGDLGTEFWLGNALRGLVKVYLKKA